MARRGARLGLATLCVSGGLGMAHGDRAPRTYSATATGDVLSYDRQSVRIAVIPGDGIGKDVTAEAVKVLRAVAGRFGRPIDLEMLP
jgi:uncharacterized protein involved in exopolysaccharide biosynthesis